MGVSSRRECNASAPGRYSVLVKSNCGAWLLASPSFRDDTYILLRHAGSGLCPRRPILGLPHRPRHWPNAGSRAGGIDVGRECGLASRAWHRLYHCRHFHCFMVGPFPGILTQPSVLLRDAGVRNAVLTGVTITLYSLVDKLGVEHAQPFLFMYLITIGSAIGLSPYILFKCGLAQIRREWQLNAWAILAAGLLVFLAYGLVLTAFSLSQVSYVAPAREIGIVIGVLMGVFILKEGFGRGRILGSLFIVLGLTSIALSP